MQSTQRRVDTFRATVKDEARGIIMKLEGKMVGPWVKECRMAWLGIRADLASQKFCLDLRDMTFVDVSGMQLLREIYQSTHAEILTDSPLTRHFAERARR